MLFIDLLLLVILLEIFFKIMTCTLGGQGFDSFRQ